MRNLTHALLFLFAAASAQAQTSSWTTGVYSYDGAGNIRAIGADAFQYDHLGRIQNATIDGALHAFTYDGFGNLITLATPSFTTHLGVDSHTNRLDQQHTPAGDPADAFGTYDADGNVLVMNTDQFTPALDGPLLESTVDGRRVVYVYTPADERIGTVVIANGAELSSTWTVRDAAGHVLRRYTRANGAWIWQEDYVYRDGQLLAAETNGRDQTLHFHLDHLGTPRLITGNGGVKLAEHKYAPFGLELTSTQQDAEPLKFTGHERDDDTLDYMHARFYNAAFGRFLSVDPVQGGTPQSLNRYSYVRNVPMNMTDPLGMWSEGLDPKFSVSGEITVLGQFDSVWDVFRQGVSEISSMSIDRHIVQKIEKVVKQQVCGVIPRGRTYGVSGSAGMIGGVGGAEIVINYDSGQVSGFTYGGFQLGGAGTGSLSLYNGYIWGGLKGDNSNYAEGFTGVNAAEAEFGGFASSSSGGPFGGIENMKPDFKVIAAGGVVSVGAGGLPVGLSVTNYSKPLQLGKYWGFREPGDLALYQARQLCR